MNNLDSMFKEISMSFLNWEKIDISISSTTETWSSRLQMVERLKSGTLTKSPRLSKLDTTTKIGISRILERLTTCKFGASTHNGSKSSKSKVITLSIQLT